MKTEKSAVPWTGFDLLLFIALWFGGQVVVGGVGEWIVPSDPQVVDPVDVEDRGHSMTQLIQQGKHSPVIILVAFLVAVVAAPLVEELLFRLFFQGWLEAKLRQFGMPCASGVAIVTVSFCFAAIHGGSRGTLEGQILLPMFVAVIILSLLISALGIIYLVWVRHVKKTDLFGTEPFFRPRFFANTGYCFLALMFCLGLNGTLNLFYPHANTDPIPIFFISLIFGTLYSRTRNISYSILLHACLNGVSLTLIWLEAMFAGSL